MAHSADEVIGGMAGEIAGILNPKSADGDESHAGQTLLPILLYAVSIEIIEDLPKHIGTVEGRHEVLTERSKIKRSTMEKGKKEYRAQKAG